MTTDGKRNSNAFEQALRWINGQVRRRELDMLMLVRGLYLNVMRIPEQYGVAQADLVREGTAEDIMRLRTEARVLRMVSVEMAKLSGLPSGHPLMRDDGGFYTDEDFADLENQRRGVAELIGQGSPSDMHIVSFDVRAKEPGSRGGRG